MNCVSKTASARIRNNSRMMMWTSCRPVVVVLAALLSSWCFLETCFAAAYFPGGSSSSAFATHERLFGVGRRSRSSFHDPQQRPVRRRRRRRRQEPHQQSPVVVGQQPLAAALVSDADNRGTGGFSSIFSSSTYFNNQNNNNSNQHQDMPTTEPTKFKEEKLASIASASTTLTSAVAASRFDSVERLDKLPLTELAELLDRDLYQSQWFVTGKVEAKYFDRNSFTYEDADVQYHSLEAYVDDVQALFDQQVSRADIISTQVCPHRPNTITCTWRLSGRANYGPWGMYIKPCIVYTDFTIHPNTGLIQHQEDRYSIRHWDLFLSAVVPAPLSRHWTAPEAPPVPERIETPSSAKVLPVEAWTSRSGIQSYFGAAPLQDQDIVIGAHSSTMMKEEEEEDNNVVSEDSRQHDNHQLHLDHVDEVNGVVSSSDFVYDDNNNYDDDIWNEIDDRMDEITASLVPPLRPLPSNFISFNELHRQHMGTRQSEELKFQHHRHHQEEKDIEEFHDSLSYALWGRREDAFQMAGSGSRNETIWTFSI